MKKLMMILFMSTMILFTSAQNKLSGTLGPYSKSSNSYTNLSWEVNYEFVKRKDGIYLRYYNSNVSVLSNSLYGSSQKKYSKSELGLSQWPQSYSSVSLNVSTAVRLPNGTIDLSGFAVSSGNADDMYEKYICPVAMNGKAVNISDFAVSVTKAFYNPQSVAELDAIINQKKSSASNNTTATPSKDKTNSSESNSSSSSSSSPSSSSEGSSESEATMSDGSLSSSSSSSESTSESEATIYNNIFLAEAARKQQEEKAYQDVVKGVFDLFTPSAEESERKSREYIQKMEYKAELDKSLESKIEAAKNGDDQSYYDIYLAYQYSFPADARYYRKLAYSTGNASLFKAEKKLERKSPKAMFIGYQYGEISPYGLSFFQTTDNFGFFMLFRLSDKAFTTYTEREGVSKNRDVYTTANGTTYTYLSEATKQEQGKFMLSLGTSYHVFSPLFIYAGVGFALVNSFSNQRMVEYNKPEVLQIDESYYGASTDVGLLIKLGRRIAINGGVSFVNLKNPEYTGGISFNFWPEK